MTTKPIKTEGIFPHSMAWTLLLSGGVLLLPMLLLFSQTIWDKGEEIKRLEQQVQALNWIPDLYASLSQFSQYRGLRAIAAQNPGHYDFAEEHLEQLETDINRTLDQLFNTIETFSDDYPPKAVINENLLRIEQLWLLKQGESFDFTQMSELVEILNHVIARLVSQRPGIQNLLVRDIPNLRESMAQLRGSGGAYLSLFNASSANTLLDSDSAVQIQSRMEQSLWGVSSQFLLLRGSLEDQQEWLDEQALSTLFELVSKIQEVRDLIEWELLDAAEVSFPVDEFFDIATDPIDLLHLLATDLLQHVLQQSMGQLEQLKTERLWMVLLVLITVLFALLLAYRNTRQLITGIQQGIELLQQMGQGHFQQTIEPHARQGEIGLLMDALIETQQLLRENQQQLKRAVKDANQASKAKDDFLASMSHELRTPLTSIIGYAQLLAQSPINDHQHALLNTVDSAGKTLLSLVNDILDLSKIETGKFDTEVMPFDLANLIHELENLFVQRITSTGLQFEVDQGGVFTHKRMGDSLRISQILINLLGNAVKFTKQGEISLTLSREQNSEGTTYLFRVKDSGVGMESEVLERLFRPFEQADSSISRRFGGTGLGLHISYNLAQLMGGDIVVESEAGIGSTFTLLLPLEKSEERVEATSEASTAAVQQRLQGRVLIAEDMVELQILVNHLVTATGMEVELAADGREAYEMAMQQEYDLILMDMQMPEVDGIEATRMLRAAGNQVPVVALTGNVMEQHKSEFKAAGCDDFLAKPIDRQALYRVLERHQQGEGELSEPVVAAVSVEKETISPHQQSDVFNPPESVDDALIELFINRLHDSVATMTESRNQQQWSSLQSEIHMLKGSGETFGFPQITQRARKIESALKDKTYDLALTELDLLYVQIEQVFEWYSGRE